MFITAGFDELERKLQRVVGRLHIRLEERRLAKAEINLGVLGWQQVDDFPPEVEQQMRAVHAWERQQADLSNRGADIKWNIDALELQRQQHRKDFDDLIGRLEPALDSLTAARNQAEKSIPSHQESIHRFDEAIAELETAHESLGIQLRSLMMAPQTLHVREQAVRIGERKAAFENEKDDLQRSSMKISMALKSIAEQIEADDAQIQEVNQQIHKAKEEFSARDRELLSEINVMEKEKKNTSKSVDTLDQKKSPAFLAIGRCLADSDIAPMNQPEALDHVFAHREKISSLQHRIENSLARSALIPPPTLAAFYATLILFFVAIIIAAVFLLRSHPHP